MENSMTAQNILSKDDVMLLAYNTAGQSWMDEAHLQLFAKELTAIVSKAVKEKCVDDCLAVLKARYMQDNNIVDIEVLRCIKAVKEHFGEVEVTNA